LVRDASGARAEGSAETPLKSDDAALAEAAVARFKALKKDARTLASQQLLRLEDVRWCAGAAGARPSSASSSCSTRLLRHLDAAPGVGAEYGDGAV
jgi:hypothetical protein